MSRAPLLSLVAALALSGCASSPALEPEDSRGWVASPKASGEACDACGRREGAFVWGEGRRDERVSCAPCHAQAISSRRAALETLTEARGELLERFAIDLSEVPVKLELTDQPGLLARAGDTISHPELRAFTEIREQLLDERVVERQLTIVALGGLPRPFLLGIFVHELFHVWQALQGVSEVGEAALREGAALYVQHRVLKARGETRWAHALEVSRDPVYGRGLRRFQKLVAARGEPAALELGAKERRFPPGF